MPKNKRTYRKKKAKADTPKKESVATSDFRALHLVDQTGNDSYRGKLPYSRTEQYKSALSLPSNLVKVRYSAGSDNLSVVDQISKEKFILSPGDARTVVLDKSLVRSLSNAGFTFDVVT